MEPAEKTSSDNSQNNSEFAKKEPLVKPETLRKITFTLLTIAGAFIIISVGAFVVKQIINGNLAPVSTQPAATNPSENTPAETPAVPLLAYIKNTKEIWSVDINGEQKRRIMEIGVNDKDTFSTLEWKNPTELGYARCNNSNLCEIAAFNIETNSITPAVEVNTYLLNKFAWSPDESYFGFIETDSGNQLTFNLRAGTVTNTLASFETTKDVENTASTILFTPDNQHVIFSAVEYIFIPATSDRAATSTETPLIQIYRLNGTKVDEIRNGQYPFLINNETIGYLQNGQIKYKVIGQAGETQVTTLGGNNPVISPDKTKIAYWTSTGGFNNILLGLYDSNLGIHRNILRGVLLPTWIGNGKLAGIKAENCLAVSCQLYEFQVLSLALINIDTGDVKIVDQGKTISEKRFMDQANFETGTNEK